jgi:hypothetical protein
MEVTINVTDWGIVEKNKQKTIGGSYEVKAGAVVVSKTDFNKGYSGTEIQIPASIMIEVEAIDDKVRQAIIDNFSS